MRNDKKDLWFEIYGLNDLVDNENNHYGVFNRIENLLLEAINSIFIINSGPASYLKKLLHKIESFIESRPFLYDVDFFVLTPLHHKNLLPPLPNQQ